MTREESDAFVAMVLTELGERNPEWRCVRLEVWEDSFRFESHMVAMKYKSKAGWKHGFATTYDGSVLSFFESVLRLEEKLGEGGGAVPCDEAVLEII